MSPWRVAEPSRRPGSAVWHVDLAAEPAIGEESCRWLSNDERARAARFLRRADRERFVRSHRALRFILAGYLGRAPARLAFRAGGDGKPELDGPDRGRLNFNLSHSGRHALIAIAEDAAIGVDVEALRPLPDAMAIARAHFHPGEIADLTSLPPPRRTPAFFACWTRKEAVAKAHGAGLGLPLDSFRVSLPPADAALLAWNGPHGIAPAWSLHHLDPADDAVGAVAIVRPGEPCTCYRLAPNWSEPAGYPT